MPKYSDAKTEEAIKHLARDPRLAKLAEEIILPAWPDKQNDLLTDIVESIINQQLSSKAGATIFGRFKALLPEGKADAQEILKIPDEKIRACGISRPKIAYIKGICQAVVDREIEFEKLYDLPDEEVISELMKLKGIGRWTAEMILMFTLRRSDVFSVGDLALRSAVAKYYGVDREDLKKIEELSISWRPYRTTAARLLWHSMED